MRVNRLEWYALVHEASIHTHIIIFKYTPLIVCTVISWQLVRMSFLKSFFCVRGLYGDYSALFDATGVTFAECDGHGVCSKNLRQVESMERSRQSRGNNTKGRTSPCYGLHAAAEVDATVLFEEILLFFDLDDAAAPLTFRFFDVDDPV